MKNAIMKTKSGVTIIIKRNNIKYTDIHFDIPIRTIGLTSEEAKTLGEYLKREK